MREQRIQDIFARLDGDCDGVISKEHIELGLLSEQEVIMLTEILIQVDEHSLQLDYEGFRELANV